jgi:nucleotide-binding universal stress UspA family protein
MFTRILVPLDGSPAAEAVLPHAVRLARLHRAELWLLRVALARPALRKDPIDAQLRAVQEAESYLSAVSRDLEREVALHTAVRYGHAAEEIVDHAAANRVDLILMATHGRTGLAHAILGSVAEQVVRQTPCPVLLYRSRLDRPPAPLRTEPSAQPAAIDAGSGLVVLRRILCPVDFAERSETALDAAGDLAGRFQAELIVLHVVYDPLDARAARLPHPPLERLKRELLRQAECLAEERVRRRLAHLPAASTAVVAGRPGDEILRVVHGQHVDLVVMARDTFGGPEYLPGERVHERLLRSLPCPLLTVVPGAMAPPEARGMDGGAR